jgi:hypothetical protein
MRVEVVIPSKGRAHMCQKAVAVVNDPVLCIGEDEVDPYKKHHLKVRMLVHPPDVVGLGRKRQWILDNCQEEAIFMIDDDVENCTCLVGNRIRRIRDPLSVRAILENTAGIAKEIPTSAFGFAHTIDVRHFRSMAPISFTGWVNGCAFGVVGRTVKFDPRVIATEDIDFSMQTLFKHRVLYRDLRFCFEAKKYFKTTGGLASVRTMKSLQEDIEIMKKKYGSAVEFNHFKKNEGQGHHVNIRFHIQR